MDCSLPGSSVQGILQARTLEWVAISFSRGSSWPRDQTQSQSLQTGSLLPEPPGKPHLRVLSSVQFSSVTQLCLTLCDPMDCSTPGFPVHNQLPEFTQIHVHWVSDASNHLILCCPLLLLLLQSFPASGSFPMSQFFSSGGQSIEASASSLVLPRSIKDWFPLGLTSWISLQSKGPSRSSLTPQFKSIDSLVLSFLYSPTLTSIHDYWNNQSFD